MKFDSTSNPPSFIIPGQTEGVIVKGVKLRCRLIGTRVDATEIVRLTPPSFGSNLRRRRVFSFLAFAEISLLLPSPYFRFLAVRNRLHQRRLARSPTRRRGRRRGRLRCRRRGGRGRRGLLGSQSSSPFRSHAPSLCRTPLPFPILSLRFLFLPRSGVTFVCCSLARDTPSRLAIFPFS